MEIKIGYYSETDYAGVKSDKFNCIWTMVVFVNHMFMHYIINYTCEAYTSEM